MRYFSKLFFLTILFFDSAWCDNQNSGLTKSNHQGDAIIISSGGIRVPVSALSGNGNIVSNVIIIQNEVATTIMAPMLGIMATGVVIAGVLIALERIKNNNSQNNLEDNHQNPADQGN